MPTMGKPVVRSERQLQNVQMASREQKAKLQDPNKIAAKEKERLIGNITGYKENNPLYKDGAEHNKMGKDEFLKLLTVQLKNQDPMNPMEQGKMAAELAQFSSLEQLSNINKNFEGMNKNKAVEDKFYGASFLGKEVVTSGSSLKYEGEGTKADVLFNLEKPADKVLVRVFDSKNSMVAEEWRENIGRGNQTFTWDGKRLDGAFANKGEFRTQVFAWDRNADPIDVKTKNTGMVESVFFEGGETVLLVDGKKVFLRDVDSFHTPGTSAKLSGKLEQPAQPQVNAGVNFDSPAINANAANNMASNLPVAQKNNSNVNLKRAQMQGGLNSYKNQVPTTGVTNVYDVE